MKSIKHLAELHEKHAKDGLVAISVNTDARESWDRAKAFIKDKIQSKYTHYILDESVEFMFDNLRSWYPAIYVFNRQGQWVYFDEVDQEKIDETIQKFLAETK